MGGELGPRLSGFGVEQADRSLAATGQELSVGREGHGVDRAGVAKHVAAQPRDHPGGTSAVGSAMAPPAQSQIERRQRNGREPHGVAFS